MRKLPRKHIPYLIAVISVAIMPTRITSAQSPPAVIPAGVAAVCPNGNDYNASSLRQYQTALVNHYGDVTSIPLTVKAEHLEWVIERYLLAPTGIVHHTSRLPESLGLPTQYLFGDDVMTWHGALMAGLSYKYAVTKDAQTLSRLERMLDGVQLAIDATGQRGLAARCVLKSDVPVSRATQRYTAPDGTVYHLRSEAAKGTYNQLVGGLAVLMMNVYPDLSPAKQAQARRLLTEMAHHLVYFDFRLTEADDKPTEYGNLTPLVGSQSIPFNAQVAYMIVAAGYHFPSDDPKIHKRIRRQFERLREKHHVYYESPGRNFVLPQRVGNSPFIKGMNDRNHVTNAAFVGLCLEIDAARKEGRPVDADFMYQLGRTMHWTMVAIQNEGNALCNFMFAAIHQDPAHFPMISPHERGRQSQLTHLVKTGTEQLRRCPIDRFFYPGNKIPSRQALWVDAQRPHEVYYWKAGPYYRWEITGDPTDDLTASTDFLHAYWLGRRFGLLTPEQ